MKIATWNVNSVRARLPHLLRWLREFHPDVVLLQEIKTVTEGFPLDEIQDVGYSAVVQGQKSYNGVAILARGSLEDVRYGLPGDEADNQARYIEAVVDGQVRVASLYVPNGQEVGTDAYGYKLAWLGRLRDHMQTLLTHGEVCVLGGDYNIAPTPKDIYDPTKENRILCSEPERAAFRSLLNVGYGDALRLLYPDATHELFSWWDYRTHAFLYDRGWRIDQLLLSPRAVDRLVTGGVDRTPRTWDRPSDHTPVWCELKG